MNRRMIDKLTQDIGSKRKDIVDLTKNLIRIKSENPPGDVSEIAHYIKDYLEMNGLSVQMIEPERGKTNVISTIGNDAPTLIFNGHLDTVPAGDVKKWITDPYEGVQLDNYIYGRGASDMKAAIAAFIVSIITLGRYENDFRGKLSLVLVPDEESGSKLGTRYLLENRIALGDYVLMGEPTSLDLVEIGHKGALWLKLRSTGTPSHGALSPYHGVSATLKILNAIGLMINDLLSVKSNPSPDISSIINESGKILDQYLGVSGVGERVMKGITFNVGVIKGGQKINVVPDYCEAEIDIRFPLGVSKGELLTRIKRLANEVAIDYEIIDMFDPGYTDPNSIIVKKLKDIARIVLNREPSLYITWATGDAKYYRSLGIPVVNYGPGWEGVHEYNERVEIKSVIDATKIYTIAAYDLISNF